MITYCPNCEADRPVHPVRKIEEIVVRGIGISVNVEYLTCDTCGTDFDLPGADDPLAEVYREYRRRQGFVQPDQIREFRKQFGLTQHELGRLLGWGIATVSRYESGALQDEAHDRALQMIMNPGNLQAVLEKHPDALSPEKRQAVINRVRSETSAASDLLAHIEYWLTAHDPDEQSGYQRFSVEKFFNAVLFFCRGKGVPKTKLNKLLWYADFLHFKRQAVSITGARYAHCPHGPAPDKFEMLFAYIQEYTADLLTEQRSSHGIVWEDFIAARAPDLNAFSDTELQTLLDVNERFKGFSAGRISNFSHDEVGYKETKDGDLISYEYAGSLLI